MESKLFPKRQTPPIFYNMKTIESVTKNIITLVVLVGFQLDREALDFSYRLKQISRKLVCSGHLTRCYMRFTF